MGAAKRFAYLLGQLGDRAKELIDFLTDFAGVSGGAKEKLQQQRWQEFCAFNMVNVCRGGWATKAAGSYENFSTGMRLQALEILAMTAVPGDGGEGDKKKREAILLFQKQFLLACGLQEPAERFLPQLEVVCERHRGYDLLMSVPSVDVAGNIGKEEDHRWWGYSYFYANGLKDGEVVGKKRSKVSFLTLRSKGKDVSALRVGSARQMPQQQTADR